MLVILVFVKWLKIDVLYFNLEGELWRFDWERSEFDLFQFDLCVDIDG